MRTIFFSLILFLFSTSCVSTKKYTGFVKPKFEKSVSEIENENGKITFDLSKLDTITDIVKSEKLKSMFIPAIFYWGWENTIKSEIDPQTVGEIFRNSFLYYSDSLGLSEKLGNKNLEISIEKIPTSFVYTNKGYTVIVLVAYVVSGLEAIYPETPEIILSYRLRENGQNIKTGDLTIDNKDIPVKNIWKTPKKFTYMYIENFEKNVKNSAKEAVLTFLQKI
jgi:hypothetical protein